MTETDGEQQKELFSILGDFVCMSLLRKAVAVGLCWL